MGGLCVIGLRPTGSAQWGYCCVQQIFMQCEVTGTSSPRLTRIGKVIEESHTRVHRYWEDIGFSWSCSNSLG